MEMEELPEEGFTRNLVAKWRCMEETTSPAPTPQRSNVQRSTSRTTSHSRPTPPQSHHDEEEEDHVDYDSDHHVIRESDTNEDQFLPPPSFTRNMLAKFQNLEAEQAELQAQQHSLPAKKVHTRSTPY